MRHRPTGKLTEVRIGDTGVPKNEMLHPYLEYSARLDLLSFITIYHEIYELHSGGI